MWPLILRELRIESRRPVTYWLRTGAAAALFFLLFFVWGSNPSFGISGGRALFSGFNYLLAAVLWVAAPAMTADCLSREKREGTLPLLFLTSLRARDIVAAKCATHFIRCFSLVFAAFPILTVSLMLGGLTMLDAVRMMLLHLAALGLALAAGLIASAVCRRWLSARLMAVALSVSAAVFFVIFYKAMITTWSWWQTAPIWKKQTSWLKILGGELRAFWLRLAGGSSAWMTPQGGETNTTGLVLTAVFVLIVAGLVALAIGVAMSTVDRLWRQQPGEVTTRSATGLWRSRWQRWKQRGCCQGNPVRWLQESVWTTRLARMGWLVAVLVVGALHWKDPDAGRSRIWWILWGGGAFAGAASFRQELESGILELWLVSPLKPAGILSARLLTLGWILLPAVIVGVLWPWLPFHPSGGSLGERPWFEIPLTTACEVLCLVSALLVGTSLSLAALPITPTLLAAGMVGVLLPLHLTGYTLRHRPPGILALFMGLCLLNGCWAWQVALRQLCLRRFIRGRTADGSQDPESDPSELVRSKG
ncbi:MAG: hypothetical protein EXS36_13005 [Pedosphaera sp.]|nr:hypothetical protein [Pedosphaera sp.]